MMNFFYELDGGVKLYPKIWKFPSGETGVQIQPQGVDGSIKFVSITGSIRNSDDLMVLLMLVDALKRKNPCAKVQVGITHLAYARQDRVCNSGESFSLKVVGKILDTMGADLIFIIDPHSDVIDAVMDTPLVKVGVEKYIGKIYPVNCTDRILVTPDQGATKRLKPIKYMFSNTLEASKVRAENGDIISTQVNGQVAGKKVTIVDDLCDGGATFIRLAEILRAKGAVEIDLVITHGIFTKGEKVLTEVFDRIYTTNSYHYDREGEINGVIYTNIR